MVKPIAIKKNFMSIRQERQTNNNNIVYNSIINKNKDCFYNNINKKEYEKILFDYENKFGITENEFLEKCITNPIQCDLLSRLISKNSSRQGNNDEKEQINVCSLIAEQCGIYIKQLSSKSKRPTKNGIIITNEEMKKQNISKDDCLKSFDAEITGKINGFISAKVLYGSGGHQDNVFEELYILAEWWIKYRENNEVLILLIDTNLEEKFNNFYEKYHKKNIYVFDHYSFQLFMIENYYKDDNT